MFRVIECVWTQHDHRVVGLAAAICIMGSLAFFLALERAQECSAERRAWWLGMSGLAGGLGVWATHFVAMLAYDGGLSISFALLPTVLSAGIVILGFWEALGIAHRFSIPCIAAAGFVAAASVGVMHFTGMTAVQAQAHIDYEWGTIAISIVATAALFSAAFYLFSRLSGRKRILVASAAAVAAVCVLHFTAMSATTLSFDPTLPSVVTGGGREWLIGAIVASTMALVVLIGISTLIDRYLTDLKGFAGATLEGILIVRDGSVVEANERFSKMVGRAAGEMIGQDPETLLAAADGKPIIEARVKPIESAPRNGDTERTFEVAIHEIEYRGRPCRMLAVRDLTEMKIAQRQIEHLARYDGLTGLPIALCCRNAWIMP